MSNPEQKETLRDPYYWVSYLKKPEDASEEELRLIELEYMEALGRNDAAARKKIEELLKDYGYEGRWEISKDQTKNYWKIKKL